MFNAFFDRRKAFVLAVTVTLGACQLVPKGPPLPPPTPQAPTPEALPQDTERHRIALLVPLTGTNAPVGQSIANAAAMALIDTNAKNLRVTNYDTGNGAAQAAKRALGDGNTLILGPLFAEDTPAVASLAKTAKVPVISFSNDTAAAAKGVYVMGTRPGEAIQRTVAYASSRGVKNFAALAPQGTYGSLSSAALLENVRTNGGKVIAVETYDRTGRSAVDAARRLAQKGGADAVIIMDGARVSTQVAPILHPKSSGSPYILGTELWSGESSVSKTPALSGAWYSALSDSRFGQFSNSYQGRFGVKPYRIATIGYDAVLLTLRVAQNWKPGTPFPTASLISKSGFLGLDGPFRFRQNGLVERAFEVREVTGNGFTIVSPAPSSFSN